MPNFKYYLVSNDVRTEINPGGVQELESIYSLSRNGRFSHTLEISNEIILAGADYKLFLAIENGPNRCTDTMISIEKFCGGEYIPYLEGYLRPVDGEYDLDHCHVSIEITAVDPYYCYDYSAKKDIDIFEAKPSNQRTKVKIIEGNIESMESSPTDKPNPYDPSLYSGRDPRSDGWLVYKTEYWSDGNNNPRGAPVTTEWRHYYAREVLTVPCADPFPIGWVMIEDNCPTNRKFARYPVRVAYRRLPTRFFNGAEGKTDFTPAFFRGWGNPLERDRSYTYDVMGLSIPGVGTTPSDLDNGVRLGDILTYFISKFCGIPVSSAFFQINTTETFAEAYPDLIDDARTSNVIVYQKSDVKRLNASNNATKGLTTLDRFLNAVLATFNCEYRIQDDVFVIEHCSYWERTVELDLTDARYSGPMTSTNKYKYDQSKMPQYEEFQFMEAGNPDFKGVPIEYFGRCVTKVEDEKKKIISTSIVTTDVEHCLRYSGSDSDEVSDEGFVFVAAKIKSGSLYVITVNGILEEFPRVNNGLSWAHIHERFYLHNRPQQIGFMNNMYHEFKTTIPVKRQLPVTVPFCCGDELHLTEFVKTYMGDGVIEKATRNHYGETLTLELLYTVPFVDVIYTCPKIEQFSITSFTSAQVVFRAIVNDCVDPFTVNVEVTTPSGFTYINPDVLVPCTGDFSMPLEAYVGEFKFRIRRKCNDGISEWSDYITLKYETVVSCPVLPTPVFKYRKQRNIWVFEITEAAFDDIILYEIWQAGQTQPSTNMLQVMNMVVSGSTVTFDVVFRRKYEWMTTPVQGDALRVRFKRQCTTPVNSTTSLFTSFVNYTA